MEVLVLRVAPRQQVKKKKYHGTIRDIITVLVWMEPKYVSG